jgi:hypothetical protein
MAHRYTTKSLTYPPQVLAKSPKRSTHNSRRNRYSVNHLVSLKHTVSYVSLRTRRFGEIYRLHLQSQLDTCFCWCLFFWGAYYSTPKMDAMRLRTMTELQAISRFILASFYSVLYDLPEPGADTYERKCPARR